MSELVRDLGQYLIDESIASVFGKDLFLNYKPDLPDNIITLTEYGGFPSAFGDQSLLRQVQVFVRDLDYQTAYQKIWSIYNSLIKDDQFIIYYANRYLIPSALQSPVPLMVDDKERHVFVFNLSITTNKDY